MERDTIEQILKTNPFFPLNDAAYELILQEIISFKIPPSSKINESNIAKALNISRSPVRDALDKLEKKNFVNKIPGKGYFVSDFSKEEYMSIKDLSFMLEPYASGEAAIRLTDTDMATLYDMSDRLEQLFRNPNYKDLLDAELNFHMFLIRKSNNPLIQKIYEDMKFVIFRYRSYLMYKPTPDLFAIMTNDHRVICDSLMLRDKAIGEAIMRRHLSISHRTYMESGFFD